eukprot:TRINITY_DN13687_c0_g1_i4.p1 TRINITY_DN13687_c0_g1~~TRINITY_DN13687_c0_g1_i4.p1  ORF type:complete len:659 (+),score=110.04 TRINITY_DN13687_c0_g1_i4:251-2227(+)
MCNVLQRKPKNSRKKKQFIPSIMQQTLQKSSSQFRKQKIQFLNERIKNSVLTSHQQIKLSTKREFPQLKFLLNFYGIPEDIIAEFEQREALKLEEERRRLQKEKEELELQKQEEERQKLEDYKNNLESQRRGDSQIVLHPNDKQLRGSPSANKFQLVQYQAQMDFKLKAQQEIERKLKAREEREANKKAEMEKAKRKAELTAKSLKQQAFRRHLELGIVSMSQADLKDQLLLNEGSLEKGGVRIKTCPEPDLLNLEDEEEMDREAIELLMRKNKRLFRHLFNKYVSTGYMKKPKAFDSLRSRYEVISMGEYRRMLNDHKIDQQMITKSELQYIFKMINNKNKNPDLQTIEFEGFIECFLQIAIILHSKPPISLSCIPLVESLRQLLKKFEAATAARGESTVLYTDPEAASLLVEDQRLLRELNAMVEKSPNYPLPEGFKKIQEKEIVYVYELNSKLLADRESLRISLEIVDEILHQFLGVHFIEPHATVEFITKVVPDPLKVQGALTTFHSRYVDMASSKPRSVKLGELEAVRKTKPEAFLRPKMSIQTKIVVAGLPSDLRTIGYEVGSVVEEIVAAVIEGKQTIPHKKMNKAQLERIKMEEEMQKIERLKEERRRHHLQQIKHRIEEGKAASESVERRSNKNASKPPINKEKKRERI